MKQRYFIIFLLFITISNNVLASFWDELVNCLSNPCNCGQGQVSEYWDDKVKRTIDRNSLCPPYNKSRPDNTCLIQFDYPGIFTPWYLSHCAEQTSESSYFDPKIRIRYQACNIFACWNLSKTLNWDGECMIWPSGYAIPLVRICARVALPAGVAELGADPLPADPGYTYGVHLDEQGVIVSDKPFIGHDGIPFKVDRPKLCAYKDPSLIDTMTTFGLAGIDFMDYNPVNQRMHSTAGVHPIAKVIIFVFKQMIFGGVESIIQIIGSIFDMVGAESIPGLDLLQKIFQGISDIIKFIGQIFIKILEEFGKFNRVVNDYQFGCVELPQGPFPPPYCPVLSPFIPSPTTQKICEVGGYDASGNAMLTSSTLSHECVVSNLRNNFIRNSIRITYDNFVPLCKSLNNVKLNPMESDQCIDIANAELLSSAKVIHTALGYRDIIRRCDNAPAGAPCVNTKIPEPKCTVSNLGNTWCADGFRLVYATRISSKNMPSNYYRDDLPDCSYSNKVNCQEIWGVNTGAFIDVSLVFPSIENGYNLLPLSTNFSINDTNGAVKYMRASIVRTPETNNDLGDTSVSFQQTPNQICIFSDNDLVGCQERIKMTPSIIRNCISSGGTENCNNAFSCINSNGQIENCNGELSYPKVYSCDDPKASSLGVWCISSYFMPKFIATLKSGNDTVSAILEPLSVYNSDTTKYKVNMAGYDFSSFVTDDTLIVEPFNSPRSASVSSIYGIYQKGPRDQIAAPYVVENNTIVNKDGIYLYGLEYINEKYIQGGRYTCLKSSVLDPCSKNNTTNCVLAKLLYTDVVNCKDFTNLMSKYYGLKLCKNSSLMGNITCNSQVEVITGPSGKSLVVYKCSDNSYCYTNPYNSEICQVSLKNSDRVYPAPNSNPMASLGENEYYDLNVQKVSYDANGNVISDMQYDQNLYAVRSKTHIELGACTVLPVPYCNSLFENNMIFDATQLGSSVRGKCVNGYSSFGPLPLKYCSTDANTRSMVWISGENNNTTCTPGKIQFKQDTDTLNLPTSTDNNTYYTFSINTGCDAGPGCMIYPPSYLNYYYSKLSFYINDISKVRYFRITELFYDDGVKITVNSNPNPLYYDYYGGDTYYKGNSWGINNGLNIPLKNGMNEIRFDLQVYGGGNLYYKIEFKIDD